MLKLQIIFLGIGVICILTCSSNNNPISEEAHANIILDGSIQERVDDVDIHHYSGFVQNIGERRADFVVVKLIWTPGIVDSSFINGDIYTYKDGSTSNSALLLGSRGFFEVLSPRDGSYDLKIDWQELE